MNLKVFAREAAIYAMGNIGLRAAALLLTPLYTHYLTIPEFGLWAALQVAMQIMLIPMNMGMREAVVRFTKEHDLAKLVGTTTAVVIFTGVLVSLIVALPLRPAFETVLHQTRLGDLLILTCVAALANMLSVHLMAYYRASNQPFRYLFAGMAGALGLLVTTIVFFYFHGPSVPSVLYAYIASYAFVALCVLFDVWRQVGLGFEKAVIPQALRYGAPLIFSATGQFIVTGAGVFFVSYFCGLELVAIYSLGYKLAGVMTIVVALPFQLAFQPFLFANLHQAEVRRQAGRLFTYLLLVLTFMSFFIVLGSHMILPIIAPPEYADAFIVVLCLIPAQSLLGIHYFAETLLGAVKKTIILGVLNIAAATMAIAINVALIPPMGWAGAALASNVSLLLVCLIELAISVRMFHLARHIEWRRVAAMVALFATFLGALYVLSELPNFLFYAGSIACAAAAAATMYWSNFLKEDEQQLVASSARRIYSLLLMRTSQP